MTFGRVIPNGGGKGYVPLKRDEYVDLAPASIDASKRIPKRAPLAPLDSNRVSDKVVASMDVAQKIGKLWQGEGEPLNEEVLKRLQRVADRLIPLAGHAYIRGQQQDYLVEKKQTKENPEYRFFQRGVKRLSGTSRVGLVVRGVEIYQRKATPYVAKMIPLTGSEESRNELKKEYHFLQKLGHLKYVQGRPRAFVHAKEREAAPGLVAFWGPSYQKDLVQLIADSEIDKMRASYEIVSALQKVHELGVCHNDVKPENFLVDEEGVLHLSDFGTAYDAEKNDFQPFVSMGDGRYLPVADAEKMASYGRQYQQGAAAPLKKEIKGWGEKKDVFGVAVTIFHLWTKEPFPYNLIERKRKDGSIVRCPDLKNGLSKNFHQKLVDTQMPEELIGLLTRALSKKPKMRPTFKEFSDLLLASGLSK